MVKTQHVQYLSAVPPPTMRSFFSRLPPGPVHIPRKLRRTSLSNPFRPVPHFQPHINPLPTMNATNQTGADHQCAQRNRRRPAGRCACAGVCVCKRNAPPPAPRSPRPCQRNTPPPAPRSPRPQRSPKVSIDTHAALKRFKLELYPLSNGNEHATGLLSPDRNRVRRNLGAALDAAAAVSSARRGGAAGPRAATRG